MVENESELDWVAKIKILFRQVRIEAFRMDKGQWYNQVWKNGEVNLKEKKIKLAAAVLSLREKHLIKRWKEWR